jgi:hypothetical protein
MVEKAIYSYVDCVNCQELQFLDEFFMQMEPSVERILKLTRALENLSVMLLALEVINGETGMEGHAVNLIGHAAANTILTAKVYMLAHTVEGGRTPF